MHPDLLFSAGGFEPLSKPAGGLIAIPDPARSTYGLAAVVTVPTAAEPSFTFPHILDPLLKPQGIEDCLPRLSSPAQNVAQILDRDPPLPGHLALGTAVLRDGRPDQLHDLLLCDGSLL